MTAHPSTLAGGLGLGGGGRGGGGLGLCREHHTRDCPLGWCGSQRFLLRFLLLFLLPRTKPASTPNPTGTTCRRLGTWRRWALHTHKNKGGVRGGSARTLTTGSQEQARYAFACTPSLFPGPVGRLQSQPASTAATSTPPTAHWRLGAGRRQRRRLGAGRRRRRAARDWVSHGEAGLRTDLRIGGGDGLCCGVAHVEAPAAHVL